MDVIKEQLITDAESREILENSGDEKDLKFAQKNALDILRKSAIKPANEIKNLVTELKKIERLRERHIITIANFLPVDRDDLRAILHKEYSSFTEDEINLILETVKKFI